MNIENKRAQLFEVSFLQVSNALVLNYPGSDSIRINGEWIDFGISSGEWKETIETVGTPVMQELKATIPDTSSTNENFIRNLLSTEGLVLLHLTNGEKRVVGSNDFPVSISLEKSGNPSRLTLSLKRSSPEPTKILKSF